MSEIKRTFKASNTFPGRIVCIFTDDMVATSKRLDPEDDEAEHLAAFVFTDEKPAKPGKPIIVLTRNASIGDIVHESDHIAFSLLKFWGVPVTYDDNEAHAYLLEYIVEHILKLQRKLDASI
jgi:hypothetical protein